jgi:hypothetical protein
MTLTIRSNDTASPLADMRPAERRAGCRVQPPFGPNAFVEPSARR